MVTQEGKQSAFSCVMIDSHTKEILLRALDAALAEHIQTLFSVMLKDRTGQPNRAISGAEKAIASYKNARDALEMECKEDS